MTDPVTAQPTRDQLRAHLRRLIAAWDGPGNPSVSTANLAQLLDQLDAAEQRIRDLTQEVRDERGAALDQMEQVRIRDARIKAVENVLDEPDAMIGTRLHVTVDRIRRALEG